MTPQPTTVTAAALVRPVPPGNKSKGKLEPLAAHIDFSKTIIDNAHALMKKANELGISTTMGSLSMFVKTQRDRGNHPLIGRANSKKKTITVAKQVEAKDVSIEMFDNLIKELTDMRQFFVATVRENTALKKRLENFKKALTGE